MATLAIAGAGAAIGGGAATMFGATAMTGMMIGWTVGAYIGQLLFPQSTSPQMRRQDGPRLDKLQIQTGNYGEPIPTVYGSARIAGNVIWSADIKEHKETHYYVEASGKGGAPTVKLKTYHTYYYTCTFAIGICEGVITGISRIWADGKLLNDGGKNSSLMDILRDTQRVKSINFYKGTSDQEADPIIESYEGENTPAYPNLAYIVFEELRLENYGNRIPNLEFEVATYIDEKVPIIGNYKDDDDWYFPGRYAPGKPPSCRFKSPFYLKGGEYKGQRAFAIFNMEEMKQEEYTGEGFGGYTFDEYGLRGKQIVGSFKQIESLQKIKNMLNISDEYVEVIMNGSFFPFDEGPTIIFGINRPSPTPGDSYIIRYDPVSEKVLHIEFDMQIRRPNSSLLQPFGNLVMGWIPVSNGVVKPQLIVREKQTFAYDYVLNFWDLNMLDNYSVMPSIDFYTDKREEPPDKEICIDSNFLNNEFNATICDINLYQGPKRVLTDYLKEFPDIELNYGDLVCHQYKDGGSWGYLIDTQKMKYKGRFRSRIVVDTVGNDNSFFLNNTGSQFIRSDNYGFFMNDDGETPISHFAFKDGKESPIAVSNVVGNILNRVGLVQGQDFDVSGIPNEHIIGYVLTHVMTAKEAILPLAEIFQFDIIESEGMIKFNKRGSSGNEINISDNELGIKEEGSEAPKIIVTRKQENELPTKVAIEYLNYDLDYLKDSQEYELEEEKHFKNEHSLSYAIVMEADTALQTAERMLKTAWKQNTDFELTLGIDRIEIEPSDVILTSGYRIMVTDMTLHAPGYINIKGVSEDQTTYISDAEADEVYYVPVTQQRDMATFSQIMELPITT